MKMLVMAMLAAGALAALGCEDKKPDAKPPTSTPAAVSAPSSAPAPAPAKPAAGGGW
jgi:hypothetical protein